MTGTRLYWPAVLALMGLALFWITVTAAAVTWLTS